MTDSGKHVLLTVKVSHIDWVLKIFRAKKNNNSGQGQGFGFSKEELSRI